MAKRSLTHIEDPRRIIFRETFADEQSVRRNGGIPTDVTFSNGVGEFDGSTSTLLYNAVNIKAGYSFRARFKSLPLENGEYILDFRSAAGVGMYLYFNTATTVEAGGGNIYVDGVLTTTVSSDTKEIIVTGVDVSTGPLRISGYYNGAAKAEFDIDLFEIYNYTLTAEEVSNLREGKRFHELGSHAEQLGISLLDAGKGSFDSDTESWVAFSANTLEQVTEDGVTALKITYENHTSGAKGTFKAVDDISTNLTVGKRYRLKVRAKVNTGSAVWLRLYDGAVASNFSQLTTSFAWHEVVFQAEHATTAYLYMTGLSGGHIVWIDQWNIQEIVVEEVSGIINVTAQRGSIEDLNENVLTNTAMDVVKDGEIRAMKFDGSASLIDCGNPHDLLGDITVAWWMKLYGYAGGGATLPHVLANGEASLGSNNAFTIYTYGLVPGTLYARSNISSALSTGADAFKSNQWVMFAITRTAAGVTNFYKNGVTIGSVNQTNGAPIAATQNLTVGNVAPGGREFDGLLNDMRVKLGILTIPQINQLFSNERSQYRI